MILKFMLMLLFEIPKYEISLIMKKKCFVDVQLTLFESVHILAPFIYKLQNGIAIDINGRHHLFEAL